MERVVHVISRRALPEFWSDHPQARRPLTTWFKVFERSSFADFNAVERAYKAADCVAPYTIFDVGGNKYRVVTVIHYNRARVYVRHVLTHAEYDDWSRRMRKRRGGPR
jgi:mRNA interferase HigB